MPCRPRADFSTSFTHSINLFSLIMWCQGTYLYKLLSFPILAGSGQHPGPASGAIWPCWMKLKWPSAAPRPDLCLLEEKQEGSIAIFSSSGLAKFQARLEGVEELLVMLKSCLRVGRKEFLSLLSLCSSPGYRKADNKGLCPLDTTVAVFLPSWIFPNPVLIPVSQRLLPVFLPAQGLPSCCLQGRWACVFPLAISSPVSGQLVRSQSLLPFFQALFIRPARVVLVHVVSQCLSVPPASTPETAGTNGSWKSLLGSWSCLSIRIDNPDIRINNPDG